MREFDYDDPYAQRGWGGKTPEARRWDKSWTGLLGDETVWGDMLERAGFLRSMGRLSSLLAQDERFWNLSAKHAVRYFLKELRHDGLLLLNEDGDFERRVRDPRTSIVFEPAMDWRFFSKLILQALLAPLATLGGVTSKDLSRFDDVKNQADKVRGIVTYAHFIKKLDDLIWEDELIERITAKSFVDSVIAIAEERDQSISPPDPEPEWPTFFLKIASAVRSGNKSVSPRPEFD